jgi:hypothetical protein
VTSRASCSTSWGCPTTRSQAEQHIRHTARDRQSTQHSDSGGGADVSRYRSVSRRPPVDYNRDFSRGRVIPEGWLAAPLFSSSWKSSAFPTTVTLAPRWSTQRRIATCPVGLEAPPFKPLFSEKVASLRGPISYSVALKALGGTGVLSGRRTPSNLLIALGVRLLSCLWQSRLLVFGFLGLVTFP